MDAPVGGTIGSPAASVEPYDVRSSRRKIQGLYVLWRIYGQKIFVLNEDATTLLSKTVADVPPDNVWHQPFPAFYIHILGRSGATLTTDRSKVGRQLKGIWVCPYPTDGALAMFCFEPVGSPYDVWPQSQIAFRTGAEAPWDVFLHGHSNKDDVCIRNAHVDGTETVRPVEKSDIKSLRSCGRFFLNAMNYINGYSKTFQLVRPKRHKSNSKKPKKQRQVERLNLKLYDYIHCGGSIKIDRTTRELISSESGEGKPLGHRVLVRGHWRHQAYGPAHQLRKLIWIMPHLKGPDNMPILSRGHLCTADIHKKEKNKMQRDIRLAN